MFENMSVLSYREAPTDSIARFVVELAARGRVFRQYDIDERRFAAPILGHDYRRSISGTRYPPLKVRGHVDRGSGSSSTTPPLALSQPTNSTSSTGRASTM